MTKLTFQLSMILFGASFFVPIAEKLSLAVYKTEREKLKAPTRPCDRIQPTPSKANPTQGHQPRTAAADPAVRGQVVKPDPNIAKGIESRLDDLIKKFDALTLDALKAAQLQGILIGCSISGVLLLALEVISLKRK